MRASSNVTAHTAAAGAITQPEPVRYRAVAGRDELVEPCLGNESRERQKDDRDDGSHSIRKCFSLVFEGRCETRGERVDERRSRLDERPETHDLEYEQKRSGAEPLEKDDRRHRLGQDGRIETHHREIEEKAGNNRDGAGEQSRDECFLAPFDVADGEQDGRERAHVVGRVLDPPP